jgi:hypothetical protein
VLLGAGALALGLGAALTTGAGVAQADTGSGSSVSRANDGPQTSIRTVVRATTIRSDAPSSSFESTKESVVSRTPSPVVGDNDAADEPGLSITQLVLENGGVPELGISPDIPFLGTGGQGCLLSRIAGALSGGLF